MQFNRVFSMVQQLTTTNKYTNFTLGSTPSITEESGGPTVTAGPVTITP